MQLRFPSSPTGSSATQQQVSKTMLCKVKQLKTLQTETQEDANPSFQHQECRAS